MSDEQISKRRLIFDGDGTADERRINLLQKLIVKWISCNDESQSEIRATYNRICCQLSAVEHSQHKSKLIKIAHKKELNSYKAYQCEMEKNIVDVKNAIESGKVLLAEARCIKHRKLVYNMIARDIEVQPPRREIAPRIKKLTKYKVQLSESIMKLNNKWSNCRKQLKVIAASANQLRMLPED